MSEQQNDSGTLTILHELMSESEYGELSQMFVLEAVRFYAKLVGDSEAQDNPEAAVNPLLWKGLALEVSKKLELKIRLRGES